MPKLPEPASSQDIDIVGLEHRVELNSLAAPLLVFIHGRAGNHAVMYAFRRQFPEHWNVLALQAPLSDPIGGYSWWLIDDQRPVRESGKEAGALAAQAIAKAAEHYGLSLDSLYLAGFSQGAALISVLLQSSEFEVQKAAMLSGFTVFIENAAKEGSGAKLFLYHGEADEVVLAEQVRRSRQKLEPLVDSVETFLEPGIGHKVGREGMRAIKSFFLEET